MVHGAPIAIAEVALRAGAAKSLVLGFSRVDEQLKVDRAPIRTLTKVAVKARRALDKAAKQAAQQSGGCPRPPPGCPVRDPEPVPRRPPPSGWWPEG